MDGEPLGGARQSPAFWLFAGGLFYILQEKKDFIKFCSIIVLVI